MTVMDNDYIRNNLLSVHHATVSLNHTIFVQLVKHMYAPKCKDPQLLSYDEIRKSTVYPVKQTSKSNQSKFGFCVKNITQWLPPQSAITLLGELVDLQVQYLLSAGDHSAPLPDMETCQCLN